MRIRTILFAAVTALVVAAAVFTQRTTEPAPAPAAPIATTPAPRPTPRVPRPVLATLDHAAEAERPRLQQDAYRELVEALRADPAGMTAELEAFLADADPKELSTQIALGALVGVGTPEMQQALVRLVAKRAQDDAFARGAIPVMAFLRAPTVETEAALRGFTQGGHSEAMQSTSHLALGIMATQLSQNDAGRASAIVGDYAARLAKAESTEERRKWLQVLGNARTEEAARAIESQLGDADPQIRRGAVEALRLAPTKDAETRLTSALGDPDPAVRASAVWSLSHRKADATTTDALLARLSVERDESVISSMLTLLWPRRDDRVITAVRQLARAHPSTAIRERAQQLLGGAS